MKKTNKKGFTLVELLAVIVILGVLLLIAVPSVTSIINSSKKKSFISNAKLIIENVESVASVESTTGESITKCYIPITTDYIKLERGSLGTGPKGIVVVSTNTTTSKVEATIYYTDGKYSTYGLLSEVDDHVTDTVDYDETEPSSKTDSTLSTTDKCSWWSVN